MVLQVATTQFSGLRLFAFSAPSLSKRGRLKYCTTLGWDMSMTPEYNTFSFGITPWVGGAPEKPLGLVGDTGARGRSIRKASLLVWALLGYAPQRLCPGVYSSL